MNMKRTVSIRALSARINRKLKSENKKLMKSAPSEKIEKGEYMIIDLTTNTVSRHSLDVESLAKELGCLADYEMIENPTQPQNNQKITKN